MTDILNNIDASTILFSVFALLGLIWLILEVIEKLSKQLGNKETERFAIDAQGRIVSLTAAPIRLADRYVDAKIEQAKLTPETDDDERWARVDAELEKLKSMIEPLHTAGSTPVNPQPDAPELS